LAVFVTFKMYEVVDFHSRSSLSAGRGVSLLGATYACGVSPVPLLPQESRSFRYNQQVKEGYS
jgi:hypothetical protein